jgi:predicted nucleic acid-binding protein
MRTYADTSFLVKLLANEPGTEAAIDLYRGLGRPQVFFLPIHALEVANAIRQRAFHQRRTLPATKREAIRGERELSLAMLEKFIARGIFLEVSADMKSALEIARTLSERHTERIGCRSFDLLHVALALELESEAFLTADRVQGKLALAEGLEVKLTVARLS